MILSAVILVLFCAWRIGRRTLFFAHILQLEGYKPTAYWSWVQQRLTDVVVRFSHRLALVWILIAAVLEPFFPDGLIPVFFLVWAATFASSRRYRRDRPKKPLAFTFRMRRTLAVSTVIALFPVAVCTYVGIATGGWWGALVFAAGFFVSDLLAPVYVLMASVFLIPVEHFIQASFKKSAKKHLADRPDLEIIAVTGSYGKTSVKHAVAEVLGHRYSVLATPGSYNTPMGICKVINDQLSPAHRVLVVEMGIRNEGDIEELCDIVRPNIALVTSVGIAHLESMGSLEAVAREKGSLVRFTKSTGHVVLNADDARVRDMGVDFTGTTWLVTCEGNPDAQISATNIQYGTGGAHFVVTDETGDSVALTTKLVGRHNISNILLAVAVGRIYGLRLRQIRRAVERLRPIPHRLEVRQEGSITVIDDAFNSNPVGARNAVEILGTIGTGRRFIVTPGMIELGDLEESANRQFGEEIAAHADVAILVGEHRTTAIADGLRAAAFPTENIRVVRTLFEAKDLLQDLMEDGDAVLFENDLPDQFNEG